MSEGYQKYDDDFATKARELFAEVEKARVSEDAAKAEHKAAKQLREGAEKELEKHLASDAKDLPLFGKPGGQP